MISRVLLFAVFGLLAAPSVMAGSLADSLTDPLARLFGADQKPDSRFLPPDEAFRPSLIQVQSPNHRLVIRWKIADGYALYRDRFRFTLTGGQGVNQGVNQGIKLGRPEIPPGVQKDEGGEAGPVAVFRGEAAIVLPLIFQDAPPASVRTVTLEMAVGYQGCAEAGFCYQPITKNLRVELAVPRARVR